MKLFKRLKSKKGFTLTEVLVSIVIFALMSAIVMQILAIAIAQHRKNDSVDKDMDSQINNLVQENALVERDTVNLVMKFVNTTGGTNNVKIDDVKIRKDGTTTDSDGRLEINTIDATIKNDGGNDNKDKNSGGMVTDDIHIYGTKGINKIIAKQESCVADGDNYNVLLSFTVDTTNTHALNGSQSKSIKIALPTSAKNIVVTPDDKMMYSMVSGTNVRFSAKKTDNKDDTYTMKIYFTVSADKFDEDYGSFAKYFIEPKSESTDTTATFDDAATNGIYNHLYGMPVKEDDAA